MPNWCECAIVCDDIEFMDALCAKDTIFGALMPTPTELSSLTVGMTTIDGEHVRQWRDVEGKAVKVPDEELAAMERKYGTTSWYDWNIAHWGTKWDHGYKRVAPNHVTFEVPWGPPEPFLNTVSRQFPNAKITLAYAECGMGFWGTTIFQDGGVIEDYHSEGSFWVDGGDEEIEDDTPLKAEVQEHIDKYQIGVGG